MTIQIYKKKRGIISIEYLTNALKILIRKDTLTYKQNFYNFKIKNLY